MFILKKPKEFIIFDMDKNMLILIKNITRNDFANLCLGRLAYNKKTSQYTERNIHSAKKKKNYIPTSL